MSALKHVDWSDQTLSHYVVGIQLFFQRDVAVVCSLESVRHSSDLVVVMT